MTRAQPPLQGRAAILPASLFKRIRRFLGLVVVAIMLFLVVRFAIYAGLSKKQADSSNQPSSEAQVDSPALPPAEANFIQIVSRAQRDARQTENDMQKGGIKANRDRSICNAMTSIQVQDWIGTVKTIDSNSDGKGVLEIVIAPDVLVKTWNNELSDLASRTLIEPGGPVFEAASVMKAGQLVAFSGTFFQGSEGDCLSEGSLTLDGKLEAPEFIFRFSKVSAYDPSRHNATTLPAPQPAAEPAQTEPVEAAAQAVAMPRELWGTWSIVRDLNVQGTSACDEAFLSSMIGTQIEYSQQVFRWKDTVVGQPNVQVEVISPERFTKDYRISFEQLGVSLSSADRITIRHPDASVTGATTEIPGDVVFLKDPNAIIFPLCGMWFEANLIAPTALN